ncbi:multicopper oxidase domain-containing protein [Alkalihalobacillus sp. MEB130]|uniref:multicopper oxidase domain-containing protein n=1 Tax=Alkalihalobacillus sp. MEB130 TaxID=2976704 RepID=UPI0028E03AF3|nr:multicopper oxidase domain-containing protein [Alkalihalobacillus sp. MEB130]MDT8861057.1 multicopper oxidase domain-containing protein [Alkalihalobacillus sp. MEB130]
MLRRYHVVAIPIRIVYNNFGDHDPDGRMYVLKENEELVRDLVRKNPFTPVDLVEPLTIRANVGDEVEILFENQLKTPSSMHFQEANYDVLTSDGANVGFNPDTTVQPGGEILYCIRVSKEGIHYFSDVANPIDGEDLGTNVHGLFGALFVQRRGSTWTDPVTGGPINSGAVADIHHPILPSFREFGYFFNDEPENDDLTGNERINPMTDQPAESVHAINYRSEPLANRIRLIEEGVVAPDADGEEVHHDSWVFGDPATPTFRGYVGDPVKIRLVHGGVKETHVFHYHVHQWLFDPEDVDSFTKDSQAISPQNHYTIEPLYGLGSLHGAIGDVIIHCHLYPHFEDGMFNINRIFNTLQDGSQCYPNGVPIKPLQPLPDRPCPPEPTLEKPGFPNFIPGKVGCKAPRPPLGIVGGREMTELEENAAVPNARPGAVFVDTCIGNPVVKEFNVSLIELPITYNKQGWHDPKGRMYILDEDLDDVLSGRKEPEPLVLQAEAGSCIRINFTNRLPNILDGDAFQLVTRIYESSMHVHFVKFDVLVSDGGNVGWNYDSSVLPGETIRYEWYADVELKATFFHDHLFASSQQQHGVFGSINLLPRFSCVFDSCTGEEVDHGTQVTVTNPIIPDYRDYTLFIHDFALLFDKDKCPIEPPPFPGSQDDPGVFGVNYKNEPLQFRLDKDCDPAYSFSSTVHGDPITPLLQAYEGDPIRFRILQGAHEESHSFNVHGLKWNEARRDVDSNETNQEHLGISESFTFETFIPRSGDYLWAFEDVEDLWIGTWGILRAFAEEVDFLIPLPDRPLPPPRVTPLPEVTGCPPEKAIDDGCVCPECSTIRSYDVVAFQTCIQYNEYGDHDPHAIIFALAEDVDDIISGKKNPEPLVIRANVDDCVEINLLNKLDPDLFHVEDGVHRYPDVKVPAFYPPSPRISLHPQLLEFDVKTSSGETVGFNPDQTVGPGECITYRWFVDKQYGICNLWDMADIRNHRHHGAFGAFIAEPRGSVYLDPCTLEPVKSGTSVVIRNPLLPDFREFVLLMHDGVRLLDKNGQLIVDPPDGLIEETDEEEFDTYDQGSRGFNYRTERLINRYTERFIINDWASSITFRDPATPVFEAYAGEPTIVRLAVPAERRRSHTFHLHGHYWRRDREDVDSAFRSTEGQNIIGHKLDARLAYGAGGLYGFPGDYMYRSGNIRWDIELGMWGIMRVHRKLQPHLPPIIELPCSDTEVD